MRPLRRQREPGGSRLARNATIGLLAGATTAACELPLVAPVQRWAERQQFGMLRAIRMPRAVRAIAGFLLLDYTLYLWHWLNHRVPWLWRFHAVHHLDLDLDSSTGVRFHFGELFLSAFFRSAQIVAFGVDRATLAFWQRLLVTSVIFHHSNLELPPALEGRLLLGIVTPRMHGIHHSTRIEETNTNYSSLLSVWDRLHRSLELGVPQHAITIGIAGCLDRRAVTLGRSLALPFSSAVPPAPALVAREQP